MPTVLHPAASAIPNYDFAGELRAILTDVALTMSNDDGWLRITGPDATRWLNGMVTNAIQSLAPGEGCYNFLLNAQGRILGDCTIYRDPAASEPAFLLKTDDSQIDAIQSHLDRFIIMDDVELARVENYPTILLLGPSAPRMLRSYYSDIDPPQIQPLRLVIDPQNGDQITAPSPGLVPAFQIRTRNPVSSVSHAGEFMRISGGLLVAGVRQVDNFILEAYRILSGIPRYGVDIRNTDKAHDLPQETGQAHALHFTKGCYLGQEIVERIHSRGSVHRIFSGFLLTGALPPAGTELTTDPAPRPVGELTSVTSIPNLADADAPPLQIALGYIRREALDKNLPLHYPGGTAAPAALPFTLPSALP